MTWQQTWSVLEIVFEITGMIVWILMAIGGIALAIRALRPELQIRSTEEPEEDERSSIVRFRRMMHPPPQ